MSQKLLSIFKDINPGPKKGLTWYPIYSSLVLLMKTFPRICVSLVLVFWCVFELICEFRDLLEETKGNKSKNIK